MLPNNKKNTLLLLAFAALGVIIYVYFFKWRTNFIYGDDVNLYMDYFNQQGFVGKMNIDVVYEKFRPVHGLSVQFLITFFQKHLKLYYAFNVGIQVANAFVMAAILNLFLRSRLLSLLLGLTVGISRFAFFNIVQLYNGGALEGLAMTFFLLFLYFAARALVSTDPNAAMKRSDILYSILFANLSMYTHERYIMILPFILLAVLLYPGFRSFSRLQKSGLSLVIVASVLLNVALKKYAVDIPFFMGTGGTPISISPSSAFAFFTEGVLSIFQVNSGPAYLVGLPFSFLSAFDKFLVLLILAGILFILCGYLVRVRKAFAQGEKEPLSNFYILLLLAILFGSLLLPAIITIRLEQRWLQAPMAVFILMLVIACSSLSFRRPAARNAFLACFALLFLWTDRNYLYKGASNLYMVGSANVVNNFMLAIRAGSITPQSDILYISEKARDPNTESTISWDLGYGNFFKFYQDKIKKLVFVDSATALTDLDKSNSQVISIRGNDIVDVTSAYVRDSLNRFVRAETMGTAETVSNKWRLLLMDNNNLDEFSPVGFYSKENGFRWTNGNASIDLPADLGVQDTLNLDMATYMPPVCNKIYPQLSLLDENGVQHAAKQKKREGDTFLYMFRLGKPVHVRKVLITSDILTNTNKDVRILSFPFVSLTVRK